MSDGYLPWTRGDVPRFLIYLRRVGGDEASIPDGILNKGIRIGSHVISWFDLFHNYEWSFGHTGGEWHFCGVLQHE